MYPGAARYAARTVSTYYMFAHRAIMTSTSLRPNLLRLTQRNITPASYASIHASLRVMFLALCDAILRRLPDRKTGDDGVREALGASGRLCQEERRFHEFEFHQAHLPLAVAYDIDAGIERRRGDKAQHGV